MDKDSVRGNSPKCPQQLNFSDCGVYVLQYVESFFEVNFISILFSKKIPVQYYSFAL